MRTHFVRFLLLWICVYVPDAFAARRVTAPTILVSSYQWSQYAKGSPNPSVTVRLANLGENAQQVRATLSHQSLVLRVLPKAGTLSGLWQSIGGGRYHQVVAPSSMDQHVEDTVPANSDKNLVFRSQCKMAIQGTECTGTSSAPPTSEFESMADVTYSATLSIEVMDTRGVLIASIESEVPVAGYLKQNEIRALAPVNGGQPF